MSITTRSGIQLEELAVIKGLKKYFGKQKTLSLSGQAYNVADLIKNLEEHLKVLEDGSAAKATWKQFVEQDRVMRAEFKPALEGLQKAVENQYGPKSTVLTEFGFKPRKARKQSASSKALAADKQRATKAAHHVASGAAANGTNGANGGSHA